MIDPIEQGDLRMRLDVRLLLTADSAAELCSTSERTWRSWDAGGLVPQAVFIGRSKFWRTAELAEWVRAGCPTRKVWDQLGAEPPG